MALNAGNLQNHGTLPAPAARQLINRAATDRHEEGDQPAASDGGEPVPAAGRGVPGGRGVGGKFYKHIIQRGFLPVGEPFFHSKKLYNNTAIPIEVLFFFLLNP